MMRRSQVFHSPWDHLRQRIHTALVRPESGGNVGSIARAKINMGIQGSWSVIGAPTIVDDECFKMAKHATEPLENINHFETLEALIRTNTSSTLKLAASARVGSSSRPHPLWVEEASQLAVDKLKSGEVTDILMVFGPESDGLKNEEIALCDWVVTIPSAPQYRSLNLSQAFLIFAYEVHRQLMPPKPASVRHSDRPTQKERLVTHTIQVAEDCGFILPGDPHKMRPRLEAILAKLPPHIEYVSTLHGLLDQVSRSVRKGVPDFKGRYRRLVEDQQRAE